MIYENGLLVLPVGYIEVRHALLLAFTFGAAGCDVLSRRIPNALVITGIAVALAYHALTPYGWGVAYALKGMALGAAVFLPFYLLRAMGAGDVKLVAMVGGYLGAWSMATAAVLILMAGGVLALVMGGAAGVLRQVPQNLGRMMTAALCAGQSSASISASRTLLKLPYGVAIAAGSLLHVVLAQRGYALL